MQTRKLYYEDGSCARFQATVLSCRPEADRYQVILDATAFYPEGGGQAGDTGTLGPVRVLDTREQEGDPVHLCDGPLEPGTRVEGAVDYDRRFDLMQQHTGEHMLSGLIHRRYGYHNKGYHVGAQFVTVDFDGVIPQEDLPSLEAELNRAVWQNLPVHCWTPSPEELPRVPYRTKRALPWPVRIVQIPGCDSCACCGIHVAATGAVGLIKILSTVGFRGGTRLEMVSGKRAFGLLSDAFDQNRGVCQAFSVPAQETAQAARRMNDTLSQLKLQLREHQRRQFRASAERCRDRGNVLMFSDASDPVLVRELADAIAETCGGIAAVFSGNDGDGYGCCLVTRQGDLRPLGRTMNEVLRGRGGGKPVCHQGRVQCSEDRIRDFFLRREGFSPAEP